MDDAPVPEKLPIEALRFAAAFEFAAPPEGESPMADADAGLLNRDVPAIAGTGRFR